MSDSNWLKGADGDALHAVLCAAGFNIRWLLRAIAKKGLAALFLVLTLWPSMRGACHGRRPSKQQGQFNERGRHGRTCHAGGRRSISRGRLRI